MLCGVIYYSDPSLSSLQEDVLNEYLNQGGAVEPHTAGDGGLYVPPLKSEKTLSFVTLIRKYE